MNFCPRHHHHRRESEDRIVFALSYSPKRFIITGCKSRDKRLLQAAVRRKMFLSILVRTKINQSNAQFALMDPRTQQQPETTENRSSEAGTSPTVSIARFPLQFADQISSIAC